MFDSLFQPDAHRGSVSPKDVFSYSVL